MHDAELVTVPLNGFTKSWEPFMKGICAQEKLPNWDRLWDDCIQEDWGGVRFRVRLGFEVET